MKNRIKNVLALIFSTSVLFLWGFNYNTDDSVGSTPQMSVEENIYILSEEETLPVLDVDYIDENATPVIEETSNEFIVLSSADINQEFSVEAESFKDEIENDLVDDITGEKLSLFTVVDIEPSVMYATSNVNIRAGANIDYDKIGILSQNQEVNVTGQANTGWYRIDYNGLDAYVSNKYLSPQRIIIKDSSVIVSDIGISSIVGIVENDGGVSQKYIDKANKELSKLPQNAIDRFVNEGWHFYVTTEDIAQTMFNGAYSRVKGATEYGSKVIKIEDRDNAIVTACLHEFGHFVWSVTNKWGNEDVINAFNIDVQNASSMNLTYGLNSAEEFYAEVFWCYVNDSVVTSKSFPNLAEIISNDLASL